MVNGAEVVTVQEAGVATKRRAMSRIKAAPKRVEATADIVVPGIELLDIKLHIVGDTPFISHAWSEKAIRMIEDKQGKKATAGREIRDPRAEYLASMSRDERGLPYIPGVYFKSGAVSACSQLDNMTKTYARGAFHINLFNPRVYFTNPVQVHENPGDDDNPTMRTDMGRIGMGVANVIYRAQFWPWEVNLDIRLNRRAISPEQIANMLNVAGFAVGVGEWRPEKNGQFGMFHVTGTAST